MSDILIQTTTFQFIVRKLSLESSMQPAKQGPWQHQSSPDNPDLVDLRALVLLHAMKPDMIGANSGWLFPLPLGLVFIDSYTYMHTHMQAPHGSQSAFSSCFQLPKLVPSRRVHSKLTHINPGNMPSPPALASAIW